MLKPNIPAVQADGFSLAIESEGDTIRVCISGNCDIPTTPLLERFLHALHLEATRVGARHVVVDCANLYFLNSSSIKALVIWIAKVKGLSSQERYLIAFRTNSKLSWQQRSLEGIRHFAADIVSIDPRASLNGATSDVKPRR